MVADMRTWGQQDIADNHSRVCWWSPWGPGTSHWWRCRSLTGSAAPFPDGSSAGWGNGHESNCCSLLFKCLCRNDWKLLIPQWHASCWTSPWRPTPPTPRAGQPWTLALTGCCQTSEIKKKRRSMRVYAECVLQFPGRFSPVMTTSRMLCNFSESCIQPLHVHVHTHTHIFSVVIEGKHY